MIKTKRTSTAIKISRPKGSTTKKPTVKKSPVKAKAIKQKDCPSKKYNRHDLIKQARQMCSVIAETIMYRDDFQKGQVFEFNEGLIRFKIHEFNYNRLIYLIKEFSNANMGYEEFEAEIILYEEYYNQIHEEYKIMDDKADE